MEKGLVSVLLPNYNGERYLEKTIESVLSQTYGHLELIVIDDGSTDGSRELLAALREKDQRLKTVLLKKNRHICYALNKGLEAARGEFIARIDVGDRFYPEKLEVQLAYFREHPECGACFALPDLIDSQGAVINQQCPDVYRLYQQPNRTQAEWLHFFVGYGNCLAHPSVVFPRKILEQTGPYDMALMQGEDFDLWIRIALIAPLHIIQKPLLACLWETNDQNKISQPQSDVNVIRFFNIRVEAVDKLFDRISDEQFVRYFRDDFQNQASAEPLELECEKSLFLLHCFQDFPEFSLLGFRRLHQLVNRPEGLELLEERFGFTLHDLYRLNAGHLFFDTATKAHLRNAEGQIQALNGELVRRAAEIDRLNHEADERNCEIGRLNHTISELRERESALIANHDRETAALQDAVGNKNRELWTIKNSTCWKITKPIRSLRPVPKSQPTIYLVATSDYGNLGDHKIAMEVRHFLQSYFPQVPVEEITCRGYEENRVRLMCQLRDEDILVMPGGGSIGDVYFPFAEKYMWEMIRWFPNNQVIIFPQSLFYSKTPEGEAARKGTAAVFDSHPDLTFALRDQNAYQEAQTMFRRARLTVMPDIVLFSDPYTGQKAREDKGLLLFRKDCESRFPAGWQEDLLPVCEGYAERIVRTDAQKDHFIDAAHRETAVNELLEEMASAKFVVTDRPHGMVFAAITSTPCVAFDNSYGKVSAQYQWIKDLPYLQIAREPGELEERLRQVLSAPTPVYSRESLQPYFDQLAQMFKL